MWAVEPFPRQAGGSRARVAKPTDERAPSEWDGSSIGQWEAVGKNVVQSAIEIAVT